MGYLLSIVVPTKDRYIYLEKLVDLIISFQTEEIELVIQDNSKDNAKFNDFISERINRHSWIKYYYNSQYLTSVQNFDCAVKNCTGDYICFIGDDDGVVRNITRYTKWMKENDITVADTETAAIAFICKANNVECVILKGISDYPTNENESTNTESHENQLNVFLTNIPIIMNNIIDNYLEFAIKNTIHYKERVSESTRIIK